MQTEKSKQKKAGEVGILPKVSCYSRCNGNLIPSLLKTIRGAPFTPQSFRRIVFSVVLKIEHLRSAFHKNKNVFHMFSERQGKKSAWKYKPLILTRRSDSETASVLVIIIMPSRCNDFVYGTAISVARQRYQVHVFPTVSSSKRKRQLVTSRGASILFALSKCLRWDVFV